MEEELDPQTPFDYLMKIIIIGDSSVGKTQILQSYSGGSFKKTHIATIGIDFKMKLLKVNGKIIKL